MFQYNLMSYLYKYINIYILSILEIEQKYTALEMVFIHLSIKSHFTKKRIHPYIYDYFLVI